MLGFHSSPVDIEVLLVIYPHGLRSLKAIEVFVHSIENSRDTCVLSGPLGVSPVLSPSSTCCPSITRNVGYRCIKVRARSSVTLRWSVAVLHLVPKHTLSFQCLLIKETYPSIRRELGFLLPRPLRPDGVVLLFAEAFSSSSSSYQFVAAAMAVSLFLP